MLSRSELIESAIINLGINYNNANFLSSKVFAIANKIFDQVINDSLTSLNFNMTKSTALLNKDFSDIINFKGEEYYPYQLPEKMIYLESVEPLGSKYRVFRDLLYSTSEENVSIVFSSETDLQRLNNNFREYFVFCLSSRLAIPLKKTDLLDFLESKKREILYKMQSAEYNDFIVNPYEEDEGNNFGLY